MNVSNAYPNPASLAYGTVRVDLLTSCPVDTVWTVYTTSYTAIYSEALPVNGAKTVVWNMQDKTGKKVAPGAYYLKVDPGSNARVQAVAVVP